MSNLRPFATGMGLTVVLVVIVVDDVVGSLCVRFGVSHVFPQYPVYNFESSVVGLILIFILLSRP